MIDFFANSHRLTTIANARPPPLTASSRTGASSVHARPLAFIAIIGLDDFAPSTAADGVDLTVAAKLIALAQNSLQLAHQQLEGQQSELLLAFSMPAAAAPPPLLRLLARVGARPVSSESDPNSGTSH